MTPTSGRRAPIDTTDDPVLEAKWQALVQAVVDAKAEAATRKLAWAEACEARGSIINATPEAIAAAEAAKAAYDEATAAVEAAQERMKAGDL